MKTTTSFFGDASTAVNLSGVIDALSGSVATSAKTTAILVLNADGRVAVMVLSDDVYVFGGFLHEPDVVHLLLTTWQANGELLSVTAFVERDGEGGSSGIIIIDPELATIKAPVDGISASFGDLSDGYIPSTTEAELKALGFTL